MLDYTALPIGSKITETEANRPLMTLLCRYGFTPVERLAGGRVVLRRDFHKLLTQQELVDQIGSMRR